MSFIESAIERAKARRVEPDRAGTYRTVPVLEPATDGVQIADDLAESTVPPPGKDIASHEFNFHAIRRVDTDPDVLRSNRVLVDTTAREPAEGAYRMLRTRVMRAMRARGWHRLGITAAGSSEGKTLTAINLAISIAAERSQPVILVDLDLRRPKVHQYLGIPGGEFVGISDYLDGSADSLDGLLFSPGIEGLSCILNSRPIERSSDLLASPRGTSFLAELTRKFPNALIILDLPPLLATDDPLVVAPMIDGVLFVVADRTSVRSEVGSAAKLLAEFNLIGTVLNMAAERVDQGYYDY